MGLYFPLELNMSIFSTKKIESSQQSVEVSAEKEYIYDKICE